MDRHRLAHAWAETKRIGPDQFKGMVRLVVAGAVGLAAGLLGMAGGGPLAGIVTGLIGIAIYAGAMFAWNYARAPAHVAADVRAFIKAWPSEAGGLRPEDSAARDIYAAKDIHMSIPETRRLMQHMEEDGIVRWSEVGAYFLTERGRALWRERHHNM